MPLRWKLVSLYAVLLAAVIGGFSLLLYQGTRSALFDSVEAEIVANLKTLGALVEVDNDEWVVDPDSGIDEVFRKDRDVYYVVRSVDGPVLLASPVAKAHGLAEGAGLGPAGRRIGGHHVREVSMRVPRAAASAPHSRPTTILIVSGKELTHSDMLLASLRTRLLVIGPVLLLVSLGAGFFLVSRALEPIGRIARTAEEISAHDLSRRISVHGEDELARLSATLNATFNRLEEGFDRERRFTADASHELRTPLSVVTGNVELGLKKDRPATEYRELLEDIGDAAARMKAIVEGLLSLARADSNAARLAREPVPLAPLCRETAALTSRLADERRISVDLSVDENAVVIGDRERLQELITNLLTNAIRYNVDGGRVAIALSRENGAVHLVVQDTGIGISPAHLPHVFERFYRADEARSSSAGGIGLGLAIAKWIAEAHGGSIRVESEEGRGSRFEVILPSE